MLCLPYAKQRDCTPLRAAPPLVLTQSAHVDGMSLLRPAQFRLNPKPTPQDVRQEVQLHFRIRRPAMRDPHPLHVVRQAGLRSCARLIHAHLHPLQVVRQEGLLALGTGLGPTLWRNCVWNSLYYGTMHTLGDRVLAPLDNPLLAAARYGGGAAVRMRCAVPYGA